MANQYQYQYDLKPSRFVRKTGFDVNSKQRSFTKLEVLSLKVHLTIGTINVLPTTDKGQ